MRTGSNEYDGLNAVGARTGKDPIDVPKIPPRLHYLAESGNWAALPSWGQFCMSVGYALGSEPIGEHVVVIALALPTRAYAAALAAAGAVLARALAQGTNPENEHLGSLLHLPKGTSVILHSDGNDLCGHFRGCRRCDSRVELGVQVTRKRSGERTYWLPTEQAGRISVARKRLKQLPKNPRKMREDMGQELVKLLVGGAPASSYRMEPRLDSLVVGPVNAIRSEVLPKTFALRNAQGEWSKGSLQEVLRLRKLLQDEEGYWSDIVRSNRRTLPQIDKPPHLAVFDGGGGFLKWRDRFRSSHWLLVLDRADPRFIEAAETLNVSEYVRRSEGEPFPQLPPVPPGVELVVFRRAVP